MLSGLLKGIMDSVLNLETVCMLGEFLREWEDAVASFDWQTLKEWLGE